MNVKCNCNFRRVRIFLLQVCFFILNTEPNYTQFCGPRALISPNFKRSSQLETKFKKKKMCEASVPLVAAAFFKVGFICSNPSLFPPSTVRHLSFQNKRKNIFSFKAKLIKYSLKRLSLPLENFWKCSALVSHSNFSNLEDKLIPLKLRDKEISVHVKDFNQLKHSQPCDTFRNFSWILIRS